MTSSQTSEEPDLACEPPWQRRQGLRNCSKCQTLCRCLWRWQACQGLAWGTDHHWSQFTDVHSNHSVGDPLGIPQLPVAVDSRCSSSTVDLALRLVLHLRQRMPATAAARLVHADQMTRALQHIAATILKEEACVMLYYVSSWCWCKLEILKSMEHVALSLPAFQLIRLTCALRPWEFDAWGRTVILVDALALTTWLCPDFVSDNVLVRCSFILSIVLVHHCLVTSFPLLWKVERSQFGPIVPYPILSQS